MKIVPNTFKTFAHLRDMNYRDDRKLTSPRPPPSLKRQNAGWEEEDLTKMVAEAKEPGKQFELPLISPDPSRPPVFSVLYATYKKTREPSDFTPNLPDELQINANGGLKALLKDVTATYSFEFKARGDKFVFAGHDRIAIAGGSYGMLSGSQDVRKENEERMTELGDDFEVFPKWRELALMEIEIMVRVMAWWNVAEKKE